MISLVEDGGLAERAVAATTFPRTGRARIVGVTGAPGAGKSSLVDRLVAARRANGQRVAVVAVDPSSPVSGGAVLGDRLRMQRHATDPGVFIRSMATRGQAGGLARATAGAVRVLDAAGWPLVIVETVGAGQVETDIASATDTTMVVVNPGWGDAMQAGKAGLMEVADVLVVNKSDRPGADEAVRDLELSLDLSSTPWRPPVVRTVATSGEGTADVWDALERHARHLADDGNLATRRADRLRGEVRRLVADAAVEAAAARCTGPWFQSVMAEVVDRRLDPLAAADRLAQPSGG